MNNYLKWGVGALGIFALLLVFVALVVAIRFKPNDYKPEIERLAKEYTGRTLTIAGDLQLAFFPSVGVKVAGVRFSERGSEEDFVTLDSAHVSVKVLPLLRGEVAVDTVRISGLNARVTKGKDGKFNFDDLLGADKRKKGAKPEPKGEGGALPAFAVSGLKIDRSSVTYRDLAAGSELVLSDFRLSTGRVAAQSQGKLDLGAALKGTKPALDAKLDLGANYRIDLPQGDVGLSKLDADLVVTTPELPQKTLKVALGGELQVDLDKQAVQGDLVTRFDETTMQAKLGIAGFAAPSYRFDINIDRLNADRYVKQGKPAPAKSGAATPGEADTPVDLSFLKGLNAGGRLQIGALQVSGLKLAKVHAEVKAGNGRMDVTPHSANLYEGSVTGALTLHADNRVALKETLAGVAIGPLLRDAAEMDRLEGRGNVALDVTAAGRTLGAMKKSLGGSAQLSLKDGALKGIDIAALLRKADSPLGRRAAASERTEFAGLFASFRIKDGVARNDDLAMHATLFRVSGQGNVDIGASQLNYNVKASLVDPRRDRAGVTVPVRFSGPFAGPAYDVDYTAVAKDVAKTKVGDRIKELLQR